MIMTNAWSIGDIESATFEINVVGQNCNSTCHSSSMSHEFECDMSKQDTRLNKESSTPDTNCIC